MSHNGMASIKTTFVTSLHSAALNGLTVCYVTQRCVPNVWLPLNTHWNVTYITMSIYCPMQSYLHNPLLRKRYHNASYFLSLFVSNLWLNVTNSTMSTIKWRYISQTQQIWLFSIRLSKWHVSAFYSNEAIIRSNTGKVVWGLEL